MWNIANNQRNLETRRALYCVWIRTSDEATAALVSIWIDPAMSAFEAQLQELKAGTSLAATISVECEGESQASEDPAPEDPLQRIYIPLISAGLV